MDETPLTGVCPGAHCGQGCGDVPDGRCNKPATRILTLVGGPFDVPPTEVEHCDRCTSHWRLTHPERVVGERSHVG